MKKPVWMVVRDDGQIVCFRRSKEAALDLTVPGGWMQGDRIVKYVPQPKRRKRGRK